MNCKAQRSLLWARPAMNWGFTTHHKPPKSTVYVPHLRRCMPRALLETSLEHAQRPPHAAILQQLEATELEQRVRAWFSRAILLHRRRWRGRWRLFRVLRRVADNHPRKCRLLCHPGVVLHTPPVQAVQGFSEAGLQISSSARARGG